MNHFLTLTALVVGLQTIAKLTKLKQLMIGDRDHEIIDDAGILSLAPIFPNLEILDIIQCSKVLR
jgi:hypothetical protein